MSRTLRTIRVGLLLAVLAVGIYAYFTSDELPKNPSWLSNANELTEAETPDTASAVDTDDCYLIAEQEGCVAVFRGSSLDSAVLVQRYSDMPISGLPEDVQQRLRQGILVQSAEELAQVLEGLDG